MNVFLDSNVLFDALFAREPFEEDAWQILDLGSKKIINLSVSTLTVVNAVYIAKKYQISVSDVKSSLVAMHEFVSFVDITEDNLVEQLGTDWKDFEDAVQYRCALDDFADVIVTRNEKDFKKSTIPVNTPQEILHALALKEGDEQSGDFEQQ